MPFSTPGLVRFAYSLPPIQVIKRDSTAATLPSAPYSSGNAAAPATSDLSNHASRKAAAESRRFPHAPASRAHGVQPGPSLACAALAASSSLKANQINTYECSKGSFK